MRKIILLLTGLAFLTFKNQAQTVTDIDGNVYNTVTIGGQIWMQENLNTLRYHNGDSILNITNTLEWSTTVTGAYCNYNNDTANASIYGRLYNWYAVNNNSNLCPTGWHVPTNNEFVILENYVGDIGAALRSTSGWNNNNGTNTSGFSGLPAGARRYTGSFSYLGNYAEWWSSTLNIDQAWSICVGSSFGYINRVDDPLREGFSIRCIKDNTADINDIYNINELKIYPNPAIDRLFIDCNERMYLKMQIYNAIGELILQRELNNGMNNIDVSSLSKGVYVIKLTGDNWTVQRKLIKE